MAANKVVMNTPEGEQTLIDLTNDSVTPETLAEGTTAHDASGQQVTGTMPTSVVLYTKQELTEEQKAQAQTNIGAVSKDDFGDFAEIVVREIPSVTFKVRNNILTDNMVSLGDGWSGNLANGFTHASGKIEPLTFAIGAVDGAAYYIEGNCPNTGETLFTMKVGDSYETDPYNGTTSIAWCLKSIGSGDFVIIPKSTFSGTITNLSCKPIGVSGTEEITVELDDIAHSPGTSHFSGIWNIQIGKYALADLVNGTRNIAIGKSSLSKLITGGRNIGLGTFTLAHAEKAENNINIGADSGNEVVTATDCVAIGRGSMYRGAKLTGNVAIGQCALYGPMTTDTVDSQYNVAIGDSAGYKNGAKSNVFIGRNAGYHNNNNMNTFIGMGAGQNNMGWGNVAIGANSDVNTSCTRSIAIGYTAKATKNYQVVIGEDAITETLLKGNLVVRGTDGVLRQIVFNDDGTCSWTAVS